MRWNPVINAGKINRRMIPEIRRVMILTHLFRLTFAFVWKSHKMDPPPEYIP